MKRAPSQCRVGGKGARENHPKQLPILYSKEMGRGKRGTLQAPPALPARPHQVTETAAS